MLFIDLLYCFYLGYRRKILENYKRPAVRYIVDAADENPRGRKSGAHTDGAHIPLIYPIHEHSMVSKGHMQKWK